MPPATTNSLFAKHHALRGQRHGFEARAADLIDGHGGDARIESAAEGRLPRGILAEPRLDDVAHDDFVDCLRLDAGAAHGFGDDFGAKLRRGKRGKPALELADGRAHGAQDHGVGCGCYWHGDDSSAWAEVSPRGCGCSGARAAVMFAV